MDFDVTGRRVVVAGGGRSGAAAARLLAGRGAFVTISDRSDRLDPIVADDGREIAVELGPHRPELFAGADLVVTSPGVPWDHPALEAARAAGATVIGEVELASRWLQGRVIAITGTKGKSTTTTLTARILREGGLDATAGGNLGNAVSSVVEASGPDSVSVLEVSSFQLEATDTFHPWIAVLLNFSADHLDRHRTLDEYGAAKARIFRNQTPDDWCVINADDPAALALARAARARRCLFGLDAEVMLGVTVENGAVVWREAGRTTPLLPVSSVRLHGRHLLADVLAAAAVSCLAGVAPAAIERAVSTFTGLEHALEPVAEIGGVRFVNDSKATNIEATQRALESFDRGIVAIMGGRFKGGRFETLRGAVTARVDAIVAIGEAAPLVHDAFGDLVPVHDASSMDEAVRTAARVARPGGVVLLAPACASFDMFADYAARGRAFKEAVGGLA